jgi:hypothetical protein
LAQRDVCQRKGDKTPQPNIGPWHREPPSMLLVKPTAQEQPQRFEVIAVKTTWHPTGHPTSEQFFEPSIVRRRRKTLFCMHPVGSQHTEGEEPDALWKAVVSASPEDLQLLTMRQYPTSIHGGYGANKACRCFLRGKKHTFNFC